MKKKLRPFFIIFICALFFIFLPHIVKNEYWIGLTITMFIQTLLVSSLRLTFLVGHLSLGHVGFALIGAYTSSLLFLKINIPFWISSVLALAFAGLIAGILGPVFMRLKGVYFAVLTLLTAESFRLVAAHWAELTAGVTGLILPIEAPIDEQYRVAGTIVFFVLSVLYWIDHSTLGRKWKLISSSEVLASANGVNVQAYKTLSFILSSICAALAGVLYAYFQHSFSPDPESVFGPAQSIQLVAYLVLGGYGFFFGPALGVLTLTIISEFTQEQAQYYLIWVGLITIFFSLLIPFGISGILSIFFDKSKGAQSGAS